MSDEHALAFLARLDQLSVKEDFLPNVGPAMIHDVDDPATMHLLELALSTLPDIEANTIIADEEGLHWKTIHRTSELVKYVAEHSPRGQGTFNFTATAMLKPLSPFFPGSYHTGPGRQFAIGFEGANVVADVFTKDRGNAEAATADLTAALTTHAKVADNIGNKVAQETGWSYVGVDPTPAPLGDVSIAAAIEDFTGAKFGSSGTLTAARIITAAVKAVPVKQIGYSGLMVPVMEDKLLAQRWAESTYNIDSLLAYSAVCGTGLDTIPLPGDVSIEQNGQNVRRCRVARHEVETSLCRHGCSRFQTKSQATRLTFRIRTSSTPRFTHCPNTDREVRFLDRRDGQSMFRSSLKPFRSLLVGDG